MFYIKGKIFDCFVQVITSPYQICLIKIWFVQVVPMLQRPDNKPVLLWAAVLHAILSYLISRNVAIIIWHCFCYHTTSRYYRVLIRFPVYFAKLRNWYILAEVALSHHINSSCQSEKYSTNWGRMEKWKEKRFIVVASPPPNIDLGDRCL